MPPGSSAHSSAVPNPVTSPARAVWITLWTLLVTLATTLILHALSPTSLRTPLVTATQLLVAIGASLLLVDLRLFPLRTIPFTHLRTSTFNDFPLMIVRYFIFFPFFVVITVHQETWIEANLLHLLEAIALITAAHLLLLKAHAQILEQTALDLPPSEGDEFPQRLGAFVSTKQSLPKGPPSSLIWILSLTFYSHAVASGLLETCLLIHQSCF